MADNLNKLLIIGHRGACGYEPENTLASFAKAIELGVDMVEFDVYVCRSGEIVIIHDGKVDRTTDGTGYVIDKTLVELRELDAGQGESIPTLNEALDLINRQTKVNIELKGVGTAKPVAEVIKNYVQEKNWQYDDFLISSFNHFELREFNQLCPAIKIGVLITGIPLGLASFAEELKAYSLNLSQEFINQEIVDDAHRRGIKVFVWTVNHLDDIKKMKELGVDGVISDFPDIYHTL